ncbi:oligomeric golgi complex component, COG2-domain-containing protein [Coniochaeta sp. 2T2.1]|nr:oligomeric golgi complex component, COG2-domain-containing protein [Coniochaeta sp. 2T2.1]
MATLSIPPLSNSRPSSSHSAAYPPSSRASDSDNDSGSDTPLPFPTALPRRDFLSPSFDAATYLSALHAGGPSAARHQSLSDLRAELRERSAAISAELLELVNANYASFLGLGDELRGGGERVGDVRVALLGFRRQVEEIRRAVGERRREVGRVTGELGEVRKGVEMARGMVELDERVDLLEERLVVGSYTGQARGGKGEDEDGVWDEDDSDEDEEAVEEEVNFVGSSPAKLEGLARRCVMIEGLADELGRELPFVRKMEERIVRCRNTILLDLSTAVREARKAGERGRSRLLRYLAVYALLDADGEAVRVLGEK